MREKRLFAVGLALLAVLLPSAALAQNSGFSLELGYRWADVTGNQDMYRSQVNEREGFILRSLVYNTTNGGDLADSISLNATDLSGVTPWGSVRIDVAKHEGYRLHVGYRRTEAFSALTTFANPLLASGVLPGQHTYDRTRDAVDIDLEITPWKAITPIIGYSFGQYAGPGTSTYHVGLDEFLLQSDLKETDQEFRVGAAFDAGVVYGQVLQGWRFFKSTETQSLGAPSTGNNPETVLGKSLGASRISLNEESDVDTPVTNIYVGIKPVKSLKIIGSYVRAAGDSEGEHSENVTGDLVSYEIQRFFGGLRGTVSSRADATTWKASGRIEWAILENLDITAGYLERSREVDGWALADELYTQVLTLGAFDPPDVTRIVESNTSLKRDEKVFDVMGLWRGIGPFDFRAGWSRAQQDLTVKADPSEIVIPQGQDGTFEREIDTFHAGLSFRWDCVTASADYKVQTADNAVMRTDFNDREQLRLRASWNPTTWFEVGATTESTDFTNDISGVDLDASYREYAGYLQLKPIEAMTLRFGASNYTADSAVTYAQPYLFTSAQSVHAEDGKGLEAGLHLDFKPVSIEAGWGRYKNEGSYPFTLDRARVVADLKLAESWGLVGEWGFDKYTEKFTSMPNWGDFTGNRYGLYLRLTP